MRLSLTIFGCRLLIATGNDTDEQDSSVAINTNSADLTPAPTPEPTYEQDDSIGFRSTQ